MTNEQYDALVLLIDARCARYEAEQFKNHMLKSKALEALDDAEMLLRDALVTEEETPFYARS